MRAGEPGFEITKNGDGGSWRINIDPGHAWKQRGAWGTPFSCFRYAIPELCDFEGRAVYLDADMLVLADVRELAEASLLGGYRCAYGNRTDVSVINCASFKDKPWWPRIAQMKPSGWISWHYVQLLTQHGAVDPTLDPRWNVCDPMQPLPDPGIGDAKLLHFTTVPTQPYRPYPSVSYIAHPWKSWVATWNSHLREVRAAAL